MIIGRIEGATREFGKPTNWDDERYGVCNTLAIRDTPVPGGNAMVSAWFPTPEELALLQAGQPIYLWIYGASHPVVALTVPA